MASDDMPDAAFTHTVRGFFGEELTIGAFPPEDPDDGGAVQFLVRDETGRTVLAHISNPAEREALARALMEAYRIADGESAAQRPKTCGQCDGGLVDAKGCTCGSPGYPDPHERLCGSEPCPNGCWNLLHPEAPSAGRIIGHAAP